MVDLLKEWNLGSNGNINLKIDKAEAKLAELEDIGNQTSEIEVLKFDLEELCMVRDSMLRQQARILWLQEGDRNTKFFHYAIQKRRSKNNISKISSHGESIVDPDKIKLAFFEHYKNQFSKRQLEKMFSINDLMIPLVTQEDNALLTREVSSQEVEEALRQSNSDKAHGQMV